MPAIAAAPVRTPRRVIDPSIIRHALELSTYDKLPEKRGRTHGGTDISTWGFRTSV
jgi:hypothetical protein